MSIFRAARRRRFTPQSKRTLLAWSIALAGFAVLVAWKMDWLPIGVDDAETGSVVADPPPQLGPPAAALSGGSSRLGDDPFGEASEEPPFAAGQSEPPIEYQKFSNTIEQAGYEQPAPFAPGQAPPFPDEAVADEPSSTLRDLRTDRAAAPTVSVSPAGTERFSSEPDALPIALRESIQTVDEQMAAGDDLSAHQTLSDIYWRHTAARDAIRERIETTAKSIYFNPQPHYMTPYEIQAGDVLGTVAAKYDVPWQYLARLNGIDPRRIRPGQKLKVIKGPFGAVVDLARFELTIHAHGYYVKSYPIGVGKDGSTPIGTRSVVDKVTNPQYTDPDGRVIAADDPANPIGEYWISLGDRYGIHGTIDPASIGRAESRGCIRLNSADVQEVYDFLTIG
ncbi:MAG: L,D-transpeptidase family protein, partial [Planctomycetaceae bacterium]